MTEISDLSSAAPGDGPAPDRDPSRRALAAGPRSPVVRNRNLALDGRPVGAWGDEVVRAVKRAAAGLVAKIGGRG